MVRPSLLTMALLALLLSGQARGMEGEEVEEEEEGFLSYFHTDHTDHTDLTLTNSSTDTAGSPADSEVVYTPDEIEQRSVSPGIGWAVTMAILIFAAANTLIIGATLAVTATVYKSLVSFLAIVSPPAAAALGSLFELLL